MLNLNASCVQYFRAKGRMEEKKRFSEAYFFCIICIYTRCYALFSLSRFFSFSELMRLLSHNPIAEGYEHQTYEDAGNDIACKAHDVSSLKHLHALISKS